MTDHFESLVRTYGDAMYRCAYSYCGNRSDAEDIVQEVFGKYLTKRPTFRDEAHEKAWLLRVTINTAKTYLRSFWRRRADLTEEELALPPAESESRELWRLVRALPPKYRLVIELYYREGYSLKEIAAVLGQKPSTVGTRFERAKRLLRDSLEQEEA